MFISESSMAGTWRNFERLICRLLSCRGFENARIVGASGDKGADIITHSHGKRYLVQVKHWKRPVGVKEVSETIRALDFYKANIPIVVARSGFDGPAWEQQRQMMARQVPLQLWDSDHLLKMARKISADSYPPKAEDAHQLRPYQEKAIRPLWNIWDTCPDKRGLIVMATGLGKTRVICEFVRRSAAQWPKLKLLALAHTNDLVYQLEQAFLPFLKASQQSLIWNGYESQYATSMEQADCVFACINTVANYVEQGGELPEFDIVFIDECHHVGETGMYSKVLDAMNAGAPGGSFLVGVTATPWRPDEYDLAKMFGSPLISIDLVAGLRNGFLSNIDYRMYTTNFDWQKVGVAGRQRKKLSPKGINRTLFVSEWDDGVVDEIEKIWKEHPSPRAIIFCGSVQHAEMMCHKINARRFCRAEAIYSAGRSGKRMAMYERNRIMSDFQIGKIQALCCVDILNEGIDVPDVNIVVFQRVTHSRRIFIQQLGRGLRLAPDKDKVIVLDFVSDVRRFAAGLSLKDSLLKDADVSGRETRVKIHHEISFYQYGGKDGKAETFLRQWLEDISAVESADEDAAVLRYPPALPEE